MRALSNPEAAARLRRLARIRAKLLAQGASGCPRPGAVRPRCGEISSAIREVLAGMSGPFTTVELRAQVERHLGRDVSQDTVSSFVTVAARRADPIVIRVAPGLYRTAR